MPISLETTHRRSRRRCMAVRLAAAAVGANLIVVGWAASASATGPKGGYSSGTVFSDVSCSSTANCTAVGSYGIPWLSPTAGPSLEPIAATETKGIWGKAVVIKAPSGDGLFTSVSCASAGSCTAVGYDYSGQVDSHTLPLVGYPIYARETSGRWGPATVLASGEGAGFFSVSCQAPTDCTAVGGDEPGDQFRGPGPFYATESAGVWGPATVVPPPTRYGYFDGVSCTEATDCTAVGADEVLDSEFGFLYDNAPITVSEVDGAWGAASEDDAPAAASAGSFVAVSCTSAKSCTGVGTDFAQTDVNGTWGATTHLSGISGVSCSAAMDCIAVGGSEPGSGGGTSIHVTETAGIWGHTKTVGGGSFAGVSCPSRTQCTAVGSFDLCAGAATCTGGGSTGSGIDPYPIYAPEIAGEWPDVSSAPRIGAVTPEPRRLKVSWRAPTRSGAPAVAGYTAIAEIGSSGNVHEFVCASNTMSCTISGLTNGKTYRVTVVARNAVGPSASSTARLATPVA